MALTFAVVSSSERTHEALARFCDSLQKSTGLAIEPRVLSSYSALREGVLEGKLDVVWSPPLVAVDLEDGRAASSIAVVQRSSRAGYYSALFVHAKSPIRRVEHLKGARAAWVTRESASGYVVPRWHLRSIGVRLEEAFSQEQFLAGHEAVTRAVIEGEADTGATHVGLDAVTGKLKSAPWLLMPVPPAIVRVVLLVGPIPGDVVMVRHGLAASMRRQLTGALLAVHDADDGTETLFEASRFEPVPDGHLTMLRRLSRFAETRG